MNLLRREFFQAAAALYSAITFWRAPQSAPKQPLDWTIEEHRAWSKYQFEQTGSALRELTFSTAREVANKVIYDAHVLEILDGPQIAQDAADIAKIVRQLIVKGDAFVPDRTLHPIRDGINPVLCPRTNTLQYGWWEGREWRTLSRHIRIRQLRMDRHLFSANQCRPLFHPSYMRPEDHRNTDLAALFRLGEYPLQRQLLSVYCSVVRRRIELRCWTRDFAGDTALS